MKRIFLSFVLALLFVAGQARASNDFFEERSAYHEMGVDAITTYLQQIESTFPEAPKNIDLLTLTGVAYLQAKNQSIQVAIVLRVLRDISMATHMAQQNQDVYENNFQLYVFFCINNAYPILKHVRSSFEHLLVVNANDTISEAMRGALVTTIIPTIELIEKENPSTKRR